MSKDKEFVLWFKELGIGDVGLAGGLGVGLIFREGQIVRKVPENEMVEALLDEIESMAIR